MCPTQGQSWGRVGKWWGGGREEMLFPRGDDRAPTVQTQDARL